MISIIGEKCVYDNNISKFGTDQGEKCVLFTYLTILFLFIKIL